jgi:ribosomal protein S18 acetylase RimI-like enzyme
MSRLHQSLWIAPVRRVDHFYFNLLEFRFFRDSEGGVALPFGDLRFLAHLVIIPYIAAAEVIFFRAKRYFVKFGENVVGVVAFRQESDSLFIASLGVAEEYRRLGVATFTLHYAGRLAAELGKKWLRLSVVKMNSPAQRLYVKLGFTVMKERRWSFILRKHVGFH